MIAGVAPTWPALWNRLPALGAAAAVCAAAALPTASSSASPWPVSSGAGEPKTLRTVSWNVAAVNNNPFEYWLTHPDPAYKLLMENVERFIVAPGDDDVRVGSVLTDGMFERIMQRLRAADTGPAVKTQLDAVTRIWQSDYRERLVVSGFLRDPMIGKKRLASMPDRITNTIQLADGGLAFRPTVVNCYGKELKSMDDWFDKWLAFMFHSDYEVSGKDGRMVPYKMLQKIKRSKYPDVSEEEESVSIPLQIVVQAAFDAILVNFVLQNAAGTWHGLRGGICDSTHRMKNARILEILSETYGEADIVFLQEVGNQMVAELRKAYGPTHHVVVPGSYDARRNQNSVVLARRSKISDPKEIEVAADGWDKGDLLVVKATVASNEITLASFHGDTNGLLTVPMLRRVMAKVGSGRLVFGMDANTHSRKSKSNAYVGDFEREFTDLGLLSAWGAPGSVELQPTTFNARTFLQPQLNKAAKSDELAEKGDRNPKDWLIYSPHFVTEGTAVRDNTGQGEYVADMVFPTLEFPSDHAVISAQLQLKEPGARTSQEL